MLIEALVHDLASGIIPLGRSTQKCYFAPVSAPPIQEGLFAPPGHPDGPGLYAGTCPRCDSLHFPASTSCPYCGSEKCKTQIVGKTGTLYLATVVTAPPPGYHGDVPYGFGLVDLPEGLRVVSVIAETDPSRLRTGLPLRLGWRTLPNAEGEGDLICWQYEPLEAAR